MITSAVLHDVRLLLVCMDTQYVCCFIIIVLALFVF